VIVKASQRRQKYSSSHC